MTTARRTQPWIMSMMPTATTRTAPEAATARTPAANSQVIGADGVVYGYDGNVSFGSPAWKLGKMQDINPDWPVHGLKEPTMIINLNIV